MKYTYKQTLIQEPLLRKNKKKADKTKVRW
jgi:hypothetical protein